MTIGVDGDQGCYCWSGDCLIKPGAKHLHGWRLHCLTAAFSYQLSAQLCFALHFLCMTLSVPHPSLSVTLHKHAHSQPTHWSRHYNTPVCYSRSGVQACKLVATAMLGAIRVTLRRLATTVVSALCSPPLQVSACRQSCASHCWGLQQHSTGRERQQVLFAAAHSKVP